MGRRKTKQEFIQTAREIHGEKYDYSSVEYINNKTKVKILCPMHGIFTQIPTDHLGKQANCPHCAGCAPHTTNNFIELAKEIHGDKYDYSLAEYINNRTNIKIVCPVHGQFEMTTKAHIGQKQGCKVCGYIQRGIKQRKSQEQFILEANKTHNSYYDYSLVEYTSIKSKIKIKCPVHGVFEQRAGNHINLKQGCPQCYNDRRPGSMGGYCYDYFQNNPTEKNIQGKLYIVEMTGKTDNFIKVGITKRTIKERFAVSGLGDKYFDKRIVHELSLPLYDAWLLEQKILKDLKEYQYFPNYKFSGQTECFKVKDVVFNHIEQCIMTIQGENNVNIR